MRVLIAHSQYRIMGGENRYVEAQSEMLRGHHDVAMFTPLNSDLEASATTASRMIMSRNRQTEVKRLIDRFQPDLIHLHNAYPSIGPAVHLAATSKAVPLVMTIHNHRLRCPNGLLFTKGEFCTRCLGGNHIHAVANNCLGTRAQSAAYATALWVHRFILRLQDRVSMFLCPSRYMGGVLESWGVEQDRVRILPNFVPPVVEDPTPPGQGGLYAGRLSHEKGLACLIRALRLAGDPPFVVAGDGPLRATLEQQAQHLELRNTTFLGGVPPDELKTLLKRCRYLVIPSEWRENAPLAALEAMSAGRPLIVSDIGGLPELVAEGAGLMCAPSDAEGLAEAVTRLTNDDSLAASLGSVAFDDYRRTFTPAAHLRGLEEAYRQVTSDHKP